MLHLKPSLVATLNAETHSCEARGLGMPGDSWVLEKHSQPLRGLVTTNIAVKPNKKKIKQIKGYLYTVQTFSLSILSRPGIKNGTTSLVPGGKKRG